MERKRATADEGLCATSESSDADTGPEIEPDGEVAPPGAQQAAAEDMPAATRATNEVVFDDTWGAAVWAIASRGHHKALPEGQTGEGR